MKKVTISGIKFEVDYNKPFADQIYCRTHDVFGEYIKCDLIDTSQGSKAVNLFDVPYFGTLGVGIADETIYRPYFMECK